MEKDTSLFKFFRYFIRDELFGEPVHHKKVEKLSPLATSYPGHNIITEDVGEILGEDDTGVVDLVNTLIFMVG